MSAPTKVESDREHTFFAKWLTIPSMGSRLQQNVIAVAAEFH